MSDRKPWCEVDCAGCDCDDDICHGKNHNEINKNWKTLRRYGLSVDEALEDMQVPR